MSFPQPTEKTLIQCLSDTEGFSRRYSTRRDTSPSLPFTEYRDRFWIDLGLRTGGR